MANFSTHLTYGTLLSGMGSSLCYTIGACSLTESLLLWFTGSLGSLLPDIDSDHSVVLKVIFNVAAVLAMLLSLYWLAPRLSIFELWAALAGVYGLVRFPIMLSFKKFSRHRGIFHSQLAAVFFCVLVAAAAYRLFNQAPLFAWLMGLFTGVGYLVHLALDECYSVDLTNVAIKRSFGTALKPFSLQYYGRSLVMALGVMALVYQLPPHQASWQTLRALFQPDEVVISFVPKMSVWVQTFLSAL